MRCTGKTRKKFNKRLFDLGNIDTKENLIEWFVEDASDEERRKIMEINGDYFSFDYCDYITSLTKAFKQKYPTAKQMSDAYGKLFGMDD